eukprot:TRINITY_DN1362_c0_g1_i2.p1 TRINITY_DN1362_c0_g1~~TRINITY_DN1362_c0_g1_i2.p1  ORF type:complete len:669 (-),score=95.11 TRINITY_DN1362_c0_g1_i2:937-2943(-)
MLEKTFQTVIIPKKKQPKKRKRKEEEESKQSTTTSYPFNTYSITTDSEFETFYSAWSIQTSFSWSTSYVCKIKNFDFTDMSEEKVTFCSSMWIIDGLVVSWDENVVYYINLRENKKLGIDSKAIKYRWKLIKAVMVRSENRKICFNSKIHIKLLLNVGIAVLDNIFDPRIAAWILDTENNKEKLLPQLFKEYVKQNVTLDTTPLANVYMSFLLTAALENALSLKKPLLDLLTSLEMPIVPIISHMEYYGIGFDNSIYNRYKSLIESKMEQLEKRAFEIVGYSFELTSTKQLSEILFNQLKLPFPRALKNKGKNHKSTNQEVLRHLSDAHPLPSIILEYRKLSHTINTYIDSLPKYSFFDKKMNMSRIYTTYMQTNVPTGRFATEDPNIQSITHDFDFYPANPEDPQAKGMLTREGKVVINIRNSFRSKPGYLLFSVDYSQLEFRVMAHYAQDKQLLDLFSKPGDVFIKLASVWLKIPEDSVSSADRTKTKHLMYGVLYGMGIRSLASRLGMDYREASELLRSFRSTYSYIGKFEKRSVEECRIKGYVSTLLGRRRCIPEIYSSDTSKKLAGERKIMNTICQGTGADICKRAMISIFKHIKDTKSKTRLIIQLHDELVFEIPKDEIHSIAPIIKEKMENAVHLTVPFPVKMNVGTHWGSMKAYDREEAY